MASQKENNNLINIRIPVLVLGGSTFMGRELLTRLVNQPQYIIIYINRGRKYWNDELRKQINQNQPQLQSPLIHYYGNRKERQDFTKLLRYLNKKYAITPQRKWRAVVDFCAFEYPDIESVKDAVNGLTELYVFISTDSIYDVYFGGAKSQHPVPEIEAFPSLPQEKKKAAKKKEEYGYDKMKCEMYLQKTRDEQQFPYISLRLPDVIGPYDDTSRLWAYIKWFQRAETNPVEYDQQAASTPLSLVFSQDVADLIVRLINKRPQLRDQQLCQSYHLAFRENPTLLGLLETLSKLVGSSQKIVKVRSANSFYPSVDFGTLDTSKVTQILGWKPTSLETALKTSVDFFLKKGKQYKEEESQAEKKLIKKLGL